MAWDQLTALPPGRVSNTVLVADGAVRVVLRHLRPSCVPFRAASPDERILPLLDITEHDGKPSAVFEFVPSVNLAELISALRVHQPVVQLDVVARIMVDAARLVGQLHRMSPISAHGGLSENAILIGFDGVVRITDFGAPRHSERVMSPDVGPTADVYSLAATMHAALTGHTGRYWKAVVRPVRGVNAEATQAFDEVLLTALNTDPDQRQGDAIQLADEIERTLDGKLLGADGLATFISALMSDRLSALQVFLDSSQSAQHALTRIAGGVLDSQKTYVGLGASNEVNLTPELRAALDKTVVRPSSKLPQVSDDQTRVEPAPTAAPTIPFQAVDPAVAAVINNPPANAPLRHTPSKGVVPIPAIDSQTIRTMAVKDPPAASLVGNETIRTTPSNGSKPAPPVGNETLPGRPPAGEDTSTGQETKLAQAGADQVASISHQGATSKPVPAVDASAPAPITSRNPVVAGPNEPRAEDDAPGRPAWVWAALAGASLAMMIAVTFIAIRTKGEAEENDPSVVFEASDDAGASNESLDAGEVPVVVAAEPLDAGPDCDAGRCATDAGVSGAPVDAGVSTGKPAPVKRGVPKRPPPNRRKGR